MKELSKDHIIQTLEERKLWKVGESDSFKYNNWEITLRKEEEIYAPFTYSINAKKDNSSET